MKASTQNYLNKEKKAKRQTIREKILNCFSPAIPWTSFEIQMHLGLSELVMVTRRMAELENDGLVYQTGSTVKVNNTMYAIYKLTPKHEVEAKRFNRWQSRRIDWIQQGLNFGYITKEESKLLDK